MAAFCMAVFFRGLDDAETVALTEAMLHSGSVLDLGAALGAKVDKHSTGGVGDKSRSCLAPLVAACGVPVPMMSRPRPRPHRRHARQARGDPRLPRRPAARRSSSAQLRDVGIVHHRPDRRTRAGRQEALRAARRDGDRRQSIPLIAASIMSKKLAEGIDGARPRREGRRRRVHEDARRRARARRRDGEIGTGAGTRGHVPAHGHGCSRSGARWATRSRSREALETVRGDGPADFTELVLDAAARLLGVLRPRDRRRGGAPASGGGGAGRERARPVRAVDPCPGRRPGPRRARAGARPSGRAGPARRCRDPTRRARRRRRGARVGAGRRTKADPVDHAVGILCFAKRGDTVLEGDDLAEVHARDDAAAERAAAVVLSAYGIGDHAPPERDVVLDVVR